MVIGVTQKGQPCKFCLRKGSLCHLHVYQATEHANHPKVTTPSEAYTSAAYYSYQDQQQQQGYGVTKQGQICKDCLKAGGYCYRHVDQIHQFPSGSHNAGGIPKPFTSTKKSTKGSPSKPRSGADHSSQQQQQGFGVTKEGRACKGCLKAGGYCYRHVDQMKTGSPGTEPSKTPGTRSSKSSTQEYTPPPPPPPPQHESYSGPWSESSKKTKKKSSKTSADKNTSSDDNYQYDGDGTEYWRSSGMPGARGPKYSSYGGGGATHNNYEGHDQGGSGFSNTSSGRPASGNNGGASYHYPRSEPSSPNRRAKSKKESSKSSQRQQQQQQKQKQKQHREGSASSRAQYGHSGFGGANFGGGFHYSTGGKSNNDWKYTNGNGKSSSSTPPPPPGPEKATLQDHFEALGVSNTTCYKKVRSAYCKLVLQYHPDKNADPGAAETFRRVQEAWEAVEPVLQKD